LDDIGKSFDFVELIVVYFYVLHLNDSMFVRYGFEVMVQPKVSLAVLSSPVVVATETLRIYGKLWK
jgi:hypothetical protein